MGSWLGRKLTFANVVSLVALFVALGGSSYAALKIGSGQIRNNSVKSADLRNNGVLGKDVRESTLGTVPNADRLDGLQATDFLRAAGKAADSDKLGGQNLDQVRSGIDAATLNGLSADALARKDRADTQDGQVSFSGATFQSLGGPSVTVDVGASGLIAVFAEAEINTGPFGGPSLTNYAVGGLFMDGNVFPGLPDCGGGGGALIRSRSTDPDFERVTTGVPDAGADANGAQRCAGRPHFGGPVVLRTTPGEHTFEMRYVAGDACACFTSQIRKRVLWVAPLD